MVMVVTIIGIHAPSYSEDKKGVYIKPEQVKGLPSNIVMELKKLDCLIPQGILDHTNAIEGEFAIKGQKDWAVLCSINGKSSIHIFWGGSKKCPSVIAERWDEEYLVINNQVGPGNIFEGLQELGKSS